MLNPTFTLSSLSSLPSGTVLETVRHGRRASYTLGCGGVWYGSRCRIPASAVLMLVNHPHVTAVINHRP